MNNITVKLKGGLGNQMFQYALGRRLAHERQMPLMLEISWFAGTAEIDTTRSYKLDHFLIEATTVNSQIKLTFAKRLLNMLWNKLDPDYHYQYHPGLLKGNYFDGFYQSFKYFLPINDTIIKNFRLRQEFSPAALNIEKEINEVAQSVAIHVRRGDYVANGKANKHHGTLSLEYYTAAMKLMEEKFSGLKYFVFSDDADWVKRNLQFKAPTVFVSNLDIPDYEELILMSRCKHQIIANSSFSWWSAWLNQNRDKIVIAPKDWLARKIDTADLLPPEWLKL